MSRTILLLILVLFGIFVYLAAFEGMIVWPIMAPILLLLAAYYVTTSVVTRKMLEKGRGDSDFFSIRASLVSKDGTCLTPGAIAVTSNEIVFYSRQSAKGGIKPSWSCFVQEIEGYTIKKVDDWHKGIVLSLAGSESEVKIASRDIDKKEKEFRKALGWPEE